jgi:predicted esterase
VLESTTMALDDLRGLEGPDLETARLSPPGTPLRAVVLLLHGGREHSHGTNPRHRLAVVRMRAFAGPVDRATPADVGVALARFRSRGWNGPHGHPVDDVALAIDALAERHHPPTFVLVGHSLGGRAAVRAAGHPAVGAVVALAPWLPPAEPIEQLAHRSLTLIHGAEDRTTSADASAAYAARARAVAGQVRCIRVLRSGHAMLTRLGCWHEIVAAVVAHELGVATRARFTDVVGNGTGLRDCVEI